MVGELATLITESGSVEKGGSLATFSITLRGAMFCSPLKACGSAKVVLASMVWSDPATGSALSHFELDAVSIDEGEGRMCETSEAIEDTSVIFMRLTSNSSAKHNSFFNSQFSSKILETLKGTKAES